MKELKQHTKCFNYGEFGHWSTKCLHPLKKKKDILLKSDGNVVKTTNLDSSSNGKVCAFGLLHEHQSFKNLVILDMVALTQFCEGCALGKHHKTFYKIDIMKEQSQIPSLFFHGGTFVTLCKRIHLVEHAIYCVMFKDDYLGYRLVYCIKNKFEALFCFKHLVAHV